MKSTRTTAKTTKTNQQAQSDLIKFLWNRNQELTRKIRERDREIESLHALLADKQAEDIVAGRHSKNIIIIR